MAVGARRVTVLRLDMDFQSLPTEILERILGQCSFEDLIRWQRTCRLFHGVITTSPLLTYIVELGMAGYTDEHVSPSCSRATRRRMLADAQRLWKRAAAFKLVQTRAFSQLSYWPVRYGVLLRAAPRSDDDAATHGEETRLDIDVVGQGPGAPTQGWRVTLPVGESGILHIDPAEDLVVVRTPRDAMPLREALAFFSCAPLSLRTGRTHPRAREPRLRFRLSDRVQSRPHYTRVQVHGATLAVSMASGIAFFTEIVVFDWTSGDQIASFTSATNTHCTWGDPAVLISPRCFLLASYERTDQTPRIEVHTIDEALPPREDGMRPTTHIVSFCLPRTRDSDVRLIMTPSSPHRLWAPGDAGAGFLETRQDCLMLRVYISSTQAQLQDAGFFVPLRLFLRESDAFYAESPAERATYETRVVRSKQWMHQTRWLTNEPGSWQSEVRRNQNGAGSRYAFPKYIVDFSPLELAKEVYNRRKSEPGISSFDSDVEGYTTHCDTSQLTYAGGAVLFDSEFTFSLPYREKKLPQLPEYSPDSDLQLIGDKLVSVEGGALDEVKIYQIVPEPFEITE